MKITRLISPEVEITTSLYLHETMEALREECEKARKIYYGATKEELIIAHGEVGYKFLKKRTLALEKALDLLEKNLY